MVLHILKKKVWPSVLSLTAVMAVRAEYARLALDVMGKVACC